jgi:hypothetical protein
MPYNRAAHDDSPKSAERSVVSDIPQAARRSRFSRMFEGMMGCWRHNRLGLTIVDVGSLVKVW